MSDKSEPDPDDVEVADHSRGHATQLVKFWRHGQFCDVTIMVEGRAFEAHRCVLNLGSNQRSSASLFPTCSFRAAQVLAGGSDFFAKAFGSECKDGILGGTLHLEQDFEAAAYQAVAEFIYTGTCIVSVASLLPLLRRAHFLQAAPLQRALQGAIAERVTPAWYLDAWALASDLTMTELHARLIQTVVSSNDRSHICHMSLANPPASRPCCIAQRSPCVWGAESAVSAAAQSLLPFPRRCDRL